MRLEELLKKEGLSSSEISELLYRINTEKQDDEKKIDMYNRAIQEASRLGIEELYKLYKEIGNYKLTEEEKKLLQGNITFYIKEQKNMTKANIQQMLYFISTERQEDEKKIDLYNTALFEASKFGISFLHSIYKDIKNYNLSEEEKKLLQGNVTFYIGEQKDMTPEDLQQMLFFINTERQDDEKKIELAKWMANRYFCNISDCIKLMLTPGTRGKEKKAQEKIIRVVYLKKKKDEILFEIDNKKIKSEKQIRVLKFIQKNEGLTIPEIEMHTDCSRAIINTLIKNGYLELVEEKIERDPLRNKNLASTNKLKLTEEQQTAFEKVAKSIDEKEYKRFLLYWVTGSRKNRSIFTINRKSFE